MMDPQEEVLDSPSGCPSLSAAVIIVGFLAMLANLSALTPGAVALAALSPLSGRLSDRIGVRPPARSGRGRRRPAARAAANADPSHAGDIRIVVVNARCFE
jgi:MFS family permease